VRKRIVGDTPLFLVWSLKQTCALKEEYDFDDLLMLERKLRPLQCLSEASAQHRIIDDTCIDRNPDDSFDPIGSVKGFSIDEITSAYGGVDFLRSCCHECDANACNFDRTGSQGEWRGFRRLNDERLHRFAGCYGYLQSKYESSDLFAHWAESLAKEESLENMTFPTADRISSLWLDRTLSQESKKWFEKLAEKTLNEFDELPPTNAAADSELAVNEVMNFHSALIASKQLDIALQVQVIPAGIVDKKNWKVPQHCSACCSNADSWNGICPNCGSKRPPNSPVKRFIRGDRPYWPLVRFLGEDGAKNLVSRYQNLTGERTSD
jgi:hypothetical protein